MAGFVASCTGELASARQWHPRLAPIWIDRKRMCPPAAALVRRWADRFCVSRIRLALCLNV